MRKVFLKFCFSVCLVLVASSTLLVSCIGQAQQVPVPPLTTGDSLKMFLQDYLRNLSLDGDETTRYLEAFADLNGDGKREAIVYFTGPLWCGSGGCTMLVLTPEASSYRVVTKIPIVRLPIRILANTSNGWRTLGVWVQGGGIQRGYEAELHFDGKTYPGNPSVSPAQRSVGDAPGEVLISATRTDAKLVYAR